MIISLDKIQEDIQQLPEEAQDLLVDFIQILKKRFPETNTVNRNKSERSLSFLEDAQEFIGCLEGGPGDLATNKKYLEEFGSK
jgi:hypothetical protein